MGFLHEGHMELVRRAREENATVAVSIFVNPKQFGPTEDFAAYPRDMQSDLDKLERASVDIVFAPSVDEIYPHGFDTFVDVGKIGERLEGQHRPNHFRGVATVVCKLFTIARPDQVYFGQKDGQQCMVIQRLNADLNLGAAVNVVPTVREPDGLAMSSRNVYLNREERAAAVVLYKSLCRAVQMNREGERSAETIRQEMRRILSGEPLARVDYVSIADHTTLEELDIVDRPALVSLAVRFGRTRLIDNMPIDPG
jgi:pantoate--beta-alanine ligase